MSPIDPADLGRCFDAYGASLVLYARQWLETAQAEFKKMLARTLALDPTGTAMASPATQKTGTN